LTEYFTHPYSGNGRSTLKKNEKKQSRILHVVCADQKDNQIFLIYKEIQNGAVAKLSFMRKGFLIYEEMSKYLIIYEEAISVYDFATAPF
jgi:hypothetical protein